MRENRTYGSEGGESGLTGLPYPYHAATVFAAILSSFWFWSAPLGLWCAG